MCGKSFSESGYLKRNMTGPTQERKHFNAPNVTGVFQRQFSKFTSQGREIIRVTTAFLSQITEIILIGALQVHSML